jgi:protein TonB
VQSIDAAALVRRSLAMASLSAEVDQRLQAYAKRPRQKWISARTREHRYAAYMEAWRAKVERVGNLNYPDEARRRNLSGDLLLDVAIRTDGSVVEISVRRSSGHKVLDDAAARIVRLAAPFAPFPKSIKEETDILHVQRTWRFLTGNRFSGN